MTVNDTEMFYIHFLAGIKILATEAIVPLLTYCVYLYFTPSIVISVSLCQFVCLLVSARIFQKPHPKFSIHFTCGRGLVLTAYLQIHYVLLVLWMMLCFHMMERMDQNQSRRVCFIGFARWHHWGELCCLQLQACYHAL